MAGLFTILFVISAGLLVSSMIVPDEFAKTLGKKSKRKLTRRHFGAFFGGLVLLSLILIGVTAPKTVNVKTANSIQPASTSKQETKPRITTKTEVQTKPVAFTSTTVQSSSLANGTSQITTKGVDGVETITYSDTYTDNKLTAQKQISDEVTTKPVSQVTSIGTYVAPTPTPAQVPTASCTPLTNGGKCYEPGEYCRNSDHGASGIAGNGESITCAYNNGWRWEPN